MSPTGKTTLPAGAPGADAAQSARSGRVCTPFIRGQHKISPKWAFTAGTAAMVVLAALVTALVLVKPAVAQQQHRPTASALPTPAQRSQQQPQDAGPSALSFKPAHSWHRSNIVLVSRGALLVGSGVCFADVAWVDGKKSRSSAQQAHGDQTLQHSVYTVSAAAYWYTCIPRAPQLRLCRADAAKCQQSAHSTAAAVPQTDHSSVLASCYTISSQPLCLLHPQSTTVWRQSH